MIDRLIDKYYRVKYSYFFKVRREAFKELLCLEKWMIMLQQLENTQSERHSGTRVTEDANQ